jgi:putative PEP-CTERM system histidine kinase
VLWVKDLDGRRFTWAGSWNQPALTCSEPAGSAFLGRFRDGDWVIEIDDRSTSPEWLDEVAGAWLGVPLAHTGRVIGFIVLARPRAPFKLDRETFDLLRIVARQAAVHLVEEQNARALAESQDLQEFAKRFAFVAHDLKNLASPLQLMLQNAVSHRHDPEFQEDVLATVQAALTRLDNLLRKLRSREARVASELNELIVPTDLLREQVEAIRRVHGPGAVQLECDGGRAVVAMEAGAFRSVLTHLCENAIEASGGQVQVLLRHQPMQVEIEVADRGKGMSPEFIRDKLFHPFGSTKDLGMGIGAYQARELVRAAGGDLVVASRPGTGTRMRISLPCAATQQISRPAERSSP